MSHGKPYEINIINKLNEVELSLKNWNLVRMRLRYEDRGYVMVAGRPADVSVCTRGAASEVRRAGAG